MRTKTFGPVVLLAAASAACGPKTPDLSKISNIVVIYAENRSFDNLYGGFPGANGLGNASASSMAQIDRDGTRMRELPPIWGGLTADGVKPAITEVQTAHLPNMPFAIDDPAGFNLGRNVATRDVVHRFYQNQMQIDGGKNDRFAAWSDAGGLVMGHYSAARLPMKEIAATYTLADNFFMAAFGGSFLNLQWLVCACTPYYPNADQSLAKGKISAVEADGVTLKVPEKMRKSAIDGAPVWDANDGTLTPDFYAVNTMQPPYQPSAVPPADQGDGRDTNPNNPNRLPPQTAKHIGDLLTEKGVSWAWYGGAWAKALRGQTDPPVPNFQFHHQPLNYFADMAPDTEGRKHLKDGGMAGVEFLKAIDEGKLEQVTFYKPQGNLNEHPGYADIESGDAHIANIVRHLRNGPQWKNVVVIVTYDENGGLWDHVAPPKADRWGPGIRIPAIIISPFAKRSFVDHTQYDTTSILWLIAKRFSLQPLDGMRVRNESLKAHGGQAMGDLTNALEF